MKKIFSKISVFALLLLPAATSCELDQTDPTSPQPGDVVNTMDDAEYWRLGLYSGLRGAIGFEISDVQTDNFVLTTQDANTHGPSYLWTFLNTEIDDQINEYANAYTMIRRANDVMTYIEQIRTNLGEDLTEEDDVELDQILGEAYLTRAIFYERLSTYYMDRYDAATAKTDLGMAIIDKVDLDEKPKRVSADSTYRYIKCNLDSARKYMTGADPSEYLSSPAADYLLNTDVIDMVEARVALKTGDYARAAQLAGDLAMSGRYALCTTAEGLNDMWTNDRGSEIIFQIYQSTDERGASYDAYTSPNDALSRQVGIPAYQVQVQPSMEAINLYDETDIRFPATFFAGWSYGAYMATGSANNAFVYMLAKFQGNPALQTSWTQTYNMAKMFRIPEAYLIAAEAEYRQGHMTEALAYYNALHHDARGAAELTTTDNFLDELANEYVREYIGEGLVFGVYKRLNKTVYRGPEQQPGTASNGLGMTITPDNMRWTWNIPQQDLYGNPNMVGNW